MQVLIAGNSTSLWEPLTTNMNSLQKGLPGVQPQLKLGGCKRVVLVHPDREGAKSFFHHSSRFLRRNGTIRIIIRDLDEEEM